MNELGLYIHIPFCISKCYYCDFNSYANKVNMVDKYVDYLKKEIDIYSKLIKDYQIKTIFIGGGTPTSISAIKIYEILEKVFDSFNCSKVSEITIEANPKTIDKNKLKVYKNVGINRISLGLQSSNDRLLKRIGRIHNYNDFLDNYKLIRKLGFENVNVDVMFGLPNQTIDDITETLNSVINLGVEHISYYSLIIEEGTRFYDELEKSKLELPDEELDREMYHRGIELLENNGYYHYEISNFSRKGFECKHNLVYWHVKPYIGIGLSAHSNLAGQRYNNYGDFESYFSYLKKDNLPIETTENIDTKMEMAEVVILGLRLIKGISKENFSKRFGVGIESIYGDKLIDLQNRGLIFIDNNYIKLTKLGLDLSNIVFMEFLP